MPRFTVSLSDEQYEWLEGASERQNRSKAQIIRNIIDGQRSGEASTGEMNTGERLTTQERSELAERIADLEERVDALESEAAQTGAVPGEDETAPTPERVDAGEERDSADRDGAAVADALSGWRHGRGEEEREASRTIAEQATEWLRDSPLNQARKSDVPLDEFAEADPLDRDPDTLWTQVVRSAWQHAREKGLVEQPHSRAYRWTGG